MDLPIAGLILVVRPILGGPGAERWAVAIAPLLPYLLLLWSLALTSRRLVDPRAYPLALLAVFFAGSTNGMFMPERIDHHGWQLALLALGIAAIADPKRARGGVTLGVATALSLAIGLEMLIYFAIAGAAQVLSWVADRDERERLGAYAVTLGGGTAAAFLVFASYANRSPVCDALSPVWLSDALLGGALMLALSWLSPADWKRRLALALAAAVLIAAFHALSWPHCIHRLEGVSPEVEQLWLSHVREARPIYTHGWRTMTAVLALPVTGAIGWGLLIWLRRNNADLVRRDRRGGTSGLCRHGAAVLADPHRSRRADDGRGWRRRIDLDTFPFGVEFKIGRRSRPGFVRGCSGRGGSRGPLCHEFRSRRKVHSPAAGNRPREPALQLDVGPARGRASA